ncbi:DUF6279 family lipoprotein [Thiothrix nivea]|uniref:Lipoprotein n=1 Tax=Thiothrix nivea (strain ATCC 35100 / DSM 5205 / JP2) TaxID=870187 RepID=A0A656HGE6_THINJ|nr:DUF6279 family lipoprotein [Thiothrix nivea]EIJ34460.1 hypothetical protein Thini_1884 [Thiothrix nivea DSM 5205]
MRYVFLLLAMLTLSACSYTPETLRNAYHNLGKDYARELKQMSSFTAQEQAQIDDFGMQIQQWHKQQKLPGYANTMQELATSLKTQGAIPRNQLANFMDLLEGYPHFNEAREVNLHLAELARQLREPQYAQIAAQLREDRADQEESLQALSPQKLLRQRVKAVNNFAAFVGVELTPEQLALVERHFADLPDQRTDAITTNRQWTEGLLALLEKRNQPDFPAQFARHMLDDNDARRLRQYAPATAQESRQRVLAMLEDLIASLSAGQKATLAGKLQSIADTFNGLAR